MSRPIATCTTIALLSVLCFNRADPLAAQAAVFVHTAPSGGSPLIRSHTTIDHPLINGDPLAKIVVTQYWNPPGVAPVYNDDAISVRYDELLGRWQIWNLNTLMPAGASFLVLARPIFNMDGTTGVFYFHTAGAGNTTGNSTYLDHPAFNGNPAVQLQVSHWETEDGSSYNPHNIGVWYSGAQEKWAIFNEDLATMPLASRFWVCSHACALPESFFVGRSFHTATTENTLAHVTYTGVTDPRALLLVTQVFNVGGSPGTYNDHPIGIWWDEVDGEWAIFNEDLAAMPEGASFSILQTRLIFYHGFENGSTAGWSSVLP